jgi:hypothetical protein
MLGWMPHFLYIRSLSKKIRKIYLMRGGKYVRIEMIDWMGVRSILILIIVLNYRIFNNPGIP